MATVIIPTPLRKFTDQKKEVNVGGNSVREAFDELILSYPALKKNLIDENNNLRSFVNVFVGDDDIRNLKQEHTEIEKNTIISIVPAIAGGSSN